MKSSVIKRSVTIDGRKTSVSVEDDFWRGLKDIGQANGLTLSSQVKVINDARKDGSLSAAIRLFVLDHFRSEYLARRLP